MSRYRLLGRRFAIDPPEDGYQPDDVIARAAICNCGYKHVLVAMVGYGNDWFVCVGTPEQTDPVDIALRGDKILRESAEVYFPGLAQSGRYYND